MSFRTRLTRFFVLIVVVPMVAVAFLVFRLIGDSETGKAQARANGLATAAASLYKSQSAAARVDARTIGRSGLLLSRTNLRPRLAQFATQAGLARVVVSAGTHVLADVGDHSALAPLRATSREADIPARYGGEEMALTLPHADLDGAYAIAELLRSEVAALRIPRLDEEGVLRVTASLGVAASSDALKDTLIAEADAALYTAKRQGKNQTVKATLQTANVVAAE
jgi:hypothetical protein